MLHLDKNFQYDHGNNTVEPGKYDHSRDCPQLPLILRWSQLLGWNSWMLSLYSIRGCV
jgi:hypothetical protein